MSVHRCNTRRTREILHIKRLQQGHYVTTPAQIYPRPAGCATSQLRGELNHAKWIYA